MSICLSVCLSVGRPNGFQSITWERFSPGTSNLVGLLVMTHNWTLLVLRSVGQRSRSVWPIAEKRFPFNNLRMLWSRDLILGSLVGYNQQMNPIDFEVSRSKVKVGVTELKNGLRLITWEGKVSQGPQTWKAGLSWPADEPYIFWGPWLKGQGRVDL